MNKIKYMLPAAIILAPFMASANTTTKLSDVIALVVSYLNQFLALLMGLAVVMFVFYVIRYFIMSDDKRKEGGQYILWSLVAFFVIFSMWGLVNILVSTFNIGQTNPGTWANVSNLFPH